MSTSVITPRSGWQDSKRWLWLLSPGFPLLALAALWLAMSSDWPWAYWLMPLAFFVVVPLLDLLIGEDTSNPPESAVPTLEADNYYRHVVMAFIPIQLALTVMTTMLAVSGDLGGLSLIGLLLSAGIVQGLAINTAHELGHKRGALDRWLARLALAPTFYGHFSVEHNRGHHKNVATPEDPASARMGETLWRFLPRTIIGGLRSSWSIERERLARQQQPMLSVHNEVLQAWLLSAVLLLVMVALFGMLAVPVLLMSGLIGAVLLEIVNYVEHYGLLRQRLDDGRYERCSPRHSWNNNHVISNVLLYQLQRHSDHHAHPSRSFQALRHFDDSPQLPGGYAAMIILALFPPLWFRLMDPKVAAHVEHDMTQAHLFPPRREQLMVRWHKAEL